MLPNRVERTGKQRANTLFAARDSPPANAVALGGDTRARSPAALALRPPDLDLLRSSVLAQSRTGGRCSFPERPFERRQTRTHTTARCAPRRSRRSGDDRSRTDQPQSNSTHWETHRRHDHPRWPTTQRSDTNLLHRNCRTIVSIRRPDASLHLRRCGQVARRRRGTLARDAGPDTRRDRTAVRTQPFPTRLAQSPPRRHQARAPRCLEPVSIPPRR